MNQFGFIDFWSKSTTSGKREKVSAKATRYVAVPEEWRGKQEAIETSLAELPRREITSEGIAILAKEGVWGYLNDLVMPEAANRIAEDAKMPVTSCYYGRTPTHRRQMKVLGSTLAIRV